VHEDRVRRSANWCGEEAGEDLLTSVKSRIRAFITARATNLALLIL
jgi:hypothetical protein